MKSKQNMIYMMKGGEKIHFESSIAFQLSKRTRKQYRKMKIQRIIKSING
jgi:hypothetical protein